MLRTNNAARLQETVRGVETMTRFALAVLSLASGVYTYLGVRGLLDGTATFVFFAAIIYAAAVSVAIYAFWTFMLRFVPLVTQAGQRAALFLTMAVGCLMIMAMSSWLNAAALAGSAALEQHLSVNLEGYVADFDAAHANALAAQSLLPDVQRAADRFGRLADDERMIVVDPVSGQRREVEVSRGSNFKYGMRADLIRQAVASVISYVARSGRCSLKKSGVHAKLSASCAA